MINKRLLIKNLLGHADENSFYDRKRFIKLNDQEGKAKFLKTVCALANSNPYNNAFIVIGVEDESREVIGVDFFDDSKIQNLINAYFNNPPTVTYENIIFPDIAKNKVVGLVTIRSSGRICSLFKGIWKYPKGAVFKREGSNSKIQELDFELDKNNFKIVNEIEKNSSNNIKHTLDGVIDFINHRHKDLETHYHVFKEQFVLCWAGIPKIIQQKTLYSRVDIELINEQVCLFFSAMDEVEICVEENAFLITEYLSLPLNEKLNYFPLETLRIDFLNNGTYNIQQEMLFVPPIYPKDFVDALWAENKIILEKIISGKSLLDNESEKLLSLPSASLICYLNGYTEIKKMLEEARFTYKERGLENYASLKATLRILRKLKYS